MGRWESAAAREDCQSTALPISILPARKMEGPLMSAHVGGLQTLHLESAGSPRVVDGVDIIVEVVVEGALMKEVSEAVGRR